MISSLTSIATKLFMAMLAIATCSGPIDSVEDDNPSQEEEITVEKKALVVYYSYTGNSKAIAKDFAKLVDATTLEINPAEEGLDYAANNYAIGSSLISKIKDKPNSADSYPAIKPVEVKLEEYTDIFIVCPLWWSQMAAPMQTYLFKSSADMKGKNIHLVVSSHSSGMTGVENDCKRLLPGGKHGKNLWINASNHSKRESLIKDWLKEIQYND